MKKEIKAYPLIHPTTIVVVGTIVNGKSNFTTIGDIAVAGLNPALIMISLHENHKSTEYIKNKGKMSVNMTDTSMLAKVDFAGMKSANTVNKSGLFSHKIIDDLPIIDQSPISLMCSVISHTKVENRNIFICKVDRTLIEEKLIVKDKLNLSIVKPILYGLDNSYYSGLIKVGEGYNEGLSLLKANGSN